MASQDRLKKALEATEDALFLIKRRLTLLNQIQTEMQSICGPDNWPIKNDALWALIIDAYDMLVIELASFCRSTLQNGGIFKVLIVETKNLQVKSSGGQTLASTPDDIMNHIVDANVRNAFNRLFPNHGKPRTWRGKLASLWRKIVPSHRPDFDDVNELKDRFYNEVRDVIKDRDGRRAHRHERKKNSDKVKSLGLAELESRFSSIECILNDLRLVAYRSTFGYESAQYQASQQLSKDACELLVVGSIPMIWLAFGCAETLKQVGAQNQYYYQFRDKYYSCRHLPNMGTADIATQDAQSGPSKLP